MKKFTLCIAGLLLFCCIGYAGEALDLFPDQPGTLVCWSEARSDPRPLKIHFLKVALDSRELEVVTLPGEDPDGDGPAESRLTLPDELFEKFHALAAVNANAFADLNPDNSAHPNWYEGQPVDMHGLVVFQGRTISPVESGRVPFWLDTLRKPHIGNPVEGDSVTEAVSDWFSPLLTASRIVPDASDTALHPRTALGYDGSGSWLLLAVVDGRQPGFSEGVSLYELAGILESRGCTQALNLDGGGSSILLVREPGKGIRTVNSPSGKEHRPVPVMLGVRRVSR